MQIKNIDAVESINDFLRITHGDSSVGSDPLTWKYYLNVSGEYHSTDKPMSVNSVELQGLVIPFTKASLDTYKLTKDVYSYGTDKYYQLVEKYPEQELLIKGILYPTDINRAISAQDGEILAYDERYVQSNEWGLIEEINQWIYNWLSRWNERGFTLTDELYSAARHGIMSMYLPLKIMDIRQRKIGTIHAHDFHKKLYISSRMSEDIVTSVLNEYSIQWIYRNLRYINAQRGKALTSDIIIDNLLELNKIPISWTTRTQVKQPYPSLLPDILYKDKALTTRWNTAKELYRTEAEVIDLEKDEAYYNASYLDYHTKSLSKYTRFSSMPTKVLLSYIIDKGDYVSHTYKHILIEHWGYMVASNDYKGNVVWKNTYNDLEHTLTMSEAFALYMYFTLKKLNSSLEPVGFPRWYYTHIANNTDTATVLTNMPKDVKVDTDIQDYGDQHTVIDTVIGGELFKTQIKKIYESNIYGWKKVLSKGNLYSNGIMRNMWFKYYKYGSIPLTDYPDYNTMFTALNITMPDNMSMSYIDTSLNELQKLCIGDVDEDTLRILQESVLRIFDLSTSYRTQTISKITNTFSYYGRHCGVKYTPGKISQYYSKVHPVISEPPHEDIHVTGDWFLVSFDQLTPAQQAQIGDIY